MVGGSGYVVNLIVFTLLTHGADVNHLLAAIGAFVVAVTNNFLLNRHWTFKRQGSTESHAGFQARASSPSAWSASASTSPSSRRSSTAAG